MVNKEEDTEAQLELSNLLPLNCFSANLTVYFMKFSMVDSRYNQWLTEDTVVQLELSNLLALNCFPENLIDVMKFSMVSCLPSKHP